MFSSHSTIHLRCLSAGHPIPTYSWYKDDLQIARGLNLIINNASLANSGNYFCQSHNAYGKHNSSVVNLFIWGQILLFII